MSLIVDTSVIISVITNENNKDRLVTLTESENLIAPSSIHWEVGNAFSAMFKRKKIDLALAEKAIEYYNMIPLKIVDVDIYNSLEIAYQYNIYAYDAYFLECAIEFNAPLLTLDSKLREIAKQINISIVEV